MHEQTYTRDQKGQQFNKSVCTYCIYDLLEMLLFFKIFFRREVLGIGDGGIERYACSRATGRKATPVEIFNVASGGRSLVIVSVFAAWLWRDCKARRMKDFVAGCKQRIDYLLACYQRYWNRICIVF